MKRLQFVTLTLICIFSSTLTFGQNYQWDLVVQTTFPTGLMFDDDDSLWFITQGIGVFEKDGANLITHHTGLETTNIVTGEMNQNNFITGGYGGASSYNAGTNSYTNYSMGNGDLQGSAVYDVLNNAGDYFLAMENEGASLFSSGAWTHYTTADGIAGSWFTCVAMNSTGDYYLGATSSSSEGIVNKFDGATWTSMGASDGITLNQVTAIYIDNSNNIWIGGNGFMKFDGSTWVDIPISGIQSGQSIQSIEEDINGNIWLGVGSTDVFVYDGSQVQNVIAPNNFSGRSEGILKSASGDLYVCLADGIYKVWDTTAGNENVNLSALNVYPNPSSDQLFIEGTIDDEIKLINAIGQEVLTVQLNNENTNIIDVKHLIPGIYFVYLGSQKIQKLIIE